MKAFYINHEVALALLTGYKRKDENSEEFYFNKDNCITTEEINSFCRFIYENGSNISPIVIDYHEDISNIEKKYPSIWTYCGKNILKLNENNRPDINNFLYLYPIDIKKELLYLTDLYYKKLEKSKTLIRTRKM